jgi:Uma2 family endonuclease
MGSWLGQTAEDLLNFREPGKTAELLRGVLIVREPSSTSHGKTAAELLYRVMHHVKAQDLGAVFAQDTGFKIGRDPDTVRAPDVAFVAKARLDQIAERGYAEVAPDWIAEILSHGDRPGEVLDKIGQWLDAGVRLVWVIDPLHRHASIYRADGSISIVGPGEDLQGEDVIPAFRCPLREILLP